MAGVHQSGSNVKRQLKLVRGEHDDLGTKDSSEELFSHLVSEDQLVVVVDPSAPESSPGDVHELAGAESLDSNASATAAGIGSLVAALDALKASHDELRATVQSLNHSRRHYRPFGR